MITYRQATLNDINTIANLGLLLYSDDNTFEGLRAEADEHLRSGKGVTFLAFDGDSPIALCEISLRSDYVEGTSGGAVGYIEGVFVLPEYRGQHVVKN